MKHVFFSRRRGALLAALVLVLAVFWLLRRKTVYSGGLFNWNFSAVQAEPEALLALMAQHGLTELYQTVPAGAKAEELEGFLSQASQQGVRVYVLAGEPEWGREADGDSLRTVLARVSRWNRALPEGSRFAGVLSDIEPYLLREWQEASGRAPLMDSFVKGYRAAFAQARQDQLELLACIPYFFDTEGFSEELRVLTAEGCSGLAVMNYYRGGEEKHMRTEADYAKQYGKRILTIYELQPPGTHGLTERNTYYEEGLEALSENYRALRWAFWPQRVDYALHTYQVLRELTEGKG